MDSREEILRIIRQKGPVLPVQIAKEVKTSILFASAMLSELVSAKLLKVSRVKVGGSPLYYLPEHASRLQDFSKYLPGKEQEAYNLLKEKKVLRDSSQEPAIRVALKNMKDFAWPLNATIGSSKELFWKWYIIENEDATDIIKQILGINDHKKEEQNAEKEQQNEVMEEKMQPEKPGIEEKKAAQTKKIEKNKHEAKEEKPGWHAAETANGGLLADILGYFSKNNIKVLSKEIIKKGNEIDFDVELQSSVGDLRYYCKAKAKKRVNDGDLSSAYVQGHLRKLPVLFLSYGEPTKKAKEMLNKEFRNIVFKKI